MESERYDEKIETAARMIADGDLPVDIIAKCSGPDLEKVIELQKKVAISIMLLMFLTHLNRCFYLFFPL